MYYSLDIIGITDKEQGFLIRDAVETTLLELIPDNCEDILEINVYVCDADEMGDSMGLVAEEDDFEYTIMLNKVLLNNELELYKTVVHETVHVAQYVKKELIHLPRNQYAWQGKVMDGGEYSKRPWEIQAYEIEEKLACRFANNQQFAI